MKYIGFLLGISIAIMFGYISITVAHVVVAMSMVDSEVCPEVCEYTSSLEDK